jgi:CheY-like chemotaxis protein
MIKLTVLYVEDEPYDALFMDRAFRKRGMQEALKVVSDGHQAMDYLSGNAPFQSREEFPMPAVILLDLKLPDISGFEVLSWIKQQPALQALPVVVFSSSAHPDDRAKAGQMGASDYVQKPSSGLEFVEVVDQLKERWLSLPAS